MPVQMQRYVEIDCDMQTVSVSEVLACTPPDEQAALIDKTDRVATVLETCRSAYHPRGVYRFYNPAICTLPPLYTEPAIKLIGTMITLRGKTAYEKLKNAKHCALMAISLNPSKDQTDLDVGSDIVIYDACRRAFKERAVAQVNAHIIQRASDDGLYSDDCLCPGEADFPADSTSLLYFYTQAEKRLELPKEESSVDSSLATFGVIGIYDPAQKTKKRACARCRYREFCTIRAVGMTCHGKRGTFRS
jgi:hypothetical protein